MNYRLQVPRATRDAVLNAKTQCDLVGSGDITVPARDLSKLLGAVLEIFDGELVPVSVLTKDTASDTKP